MEMVNVHKAKTNLSALIERVLRGEKIIIAKNGKPVVALQKIGKEPAKRKGGQFKDKIKIADDFDALPPEFTEHFK